MTEREPYDEAEIVSMWTEIYNIQKALDYYPPDAIIEAPPDGHAINEEQCQKLNLSPAVISLMKRLPYPREEEDEIGHHYPVLADSMALDYTNDKQIVYGRDPDNYMGCVTGEVNTEFLLPSELLLVIANQRDLGYHVVLDTATSKHPRNSLFPCARFTE